MTSTSRRAKLFSLIIAHCSLIIVGLILVAPLLQASPLRSDDGALHIYRTVALDRALHDGLLYPRWFPDLAYGYGFPFFNYREPLGYYAMELLHLGGASFPLSLNLVLAVSVIFSGLAAMWWIGDIFNQRAGFVAGIVYMASPYTLIGPLERANLPEVIALAWLPLILFSFRRLIVIGGRKYFIAAVISYAALLLTHNISSLIFTPLLIAYGLWLAVFGLSPESSRDKRRAIRDLLFAAILALALTAFFWLPALAEGNSVQLYLTHSNRNNDYHFNFLSLGELFGGPQASDPNLMNAPLYFTLGWPEIVLAIVGLMAVRRNSSRDQRAHIIAAIMAALVFIFMTLPVSLPVWDNLPLIRFVQFPWRFVGRAALPIALLGGAAIYYLGLHLSRRLALSLTVVGSIAVLIFATPFLYPRVIPIKNDLNINDVFAFEHATGDVGIDPVGAYLPVTVQDRPGGSPLEARYAADKSIRRFDRSALPNGTSIIHEAYSPNHAAIDLTGPIDFQATYLTFDFPGWQVMIDQQPVPIVPSNPLGLITFHVPAGQHHIEVSFGSTPVRSLADIISLIAIFAFAALLIKINFQSSSFSPQPSAFSSPLLTYLLIPVAFILIKSTLIDARLTPLRSTRLVDDQIAGVSHPLQIDFGGQLRLLGYDLSSSTLPSGESIRVDLYWRVFAPTDSSYQTTVGVIDDRGEMVTPKSLTRPRGFEDYPPTRLLPGNVYFVDSFDLPINPGTPPGEYFIFVEVFDRESLFPLSTTSGAEYLAGRPADAIIGQLQVTRATRAFTDDQLGIYNLRIDQALIPDLKLLGVNRDRDNAAPGDTVLLTFFWQAVQTPVRDYSLDIELIDPDNRIADTQNFLIGDRYPTSRWSVGEQIVDLNWVRVPVNLLSGLYHWRATLPNQTTLDLGSLNVTAPDRSFTIPAVQNQIAQAFEDKITLLGYQIDGAASRGQDLKVTLYWRAENEMDVSYKVFIHFLNAGGQPAAQVDAIPMNGTRPTTGWQPGEILTDTYTLSLPNDLPAGEYQLATGLYNEDNLVRLKLANGADRVDLTAINIAP